jgi:S-adenosylmethionine:tRNA ribosyltransferase-isomerase
MQLDELDYHLPAELIAQAPTRERTASRLLVAARDGTRDPVHTTFDHFADYLHDGDVLVLNGTRVVPARLVTQRADGLPVEVFFVRENGEGRFSAWARPLRKLRAGDVLRVADGVAIRYVARAGEREAIFEVEATGGVARDGVSRVSPAARSQVDALLAAHPADARLANLAAVFYSRAGDPDAGRRTLNAALKGGAEPGILLLALAQLEWSAGQRGAADAAIAQLLKLEPKNPAAHMAAGQSALARGSLDDARTHFEAVRAARPESFEAGKGTQFTFTIP